MTKTITPALVDKLYTMLSPCRLCPRECRVDRLHGEVGSCNAGSKLTISSYHQHFGEEPPLVGQHGSGTIFLTHCNLHCVFCQNYEISQHGMGHETTPHECSRMMLRLQALGCHNINLVTPTPWVPHLVEALRIAQDSGLHIPIVYNCGGYESVETLRLLEGIVDIYMPDIKYGDNASAQKYSDAPRYWDIVQKALKEMHRQVGDLVLDRGIAQRGLLIRHLVMPENIAGSKACFAFIRKELSQNTVVNVMAQYYPTHQAHEFPEINRRITAQEYRRALAELEQCGLVEGFRQTMDTIVRKIVPEWTDELRET
ncbi:radical SAM protein [candidate division WOR_3 bacterium SM23_60]|uniref:Radical SAM protein n=1 Tax=candidate division WOR_3 bacterium SM23_60 TaxID=1703780 RepID=A0A0S8GKP7_UNCW3|nr:MAG: radical SAM protein [candidate division WOR_3 bacterium SM23_60]